jgi:uncharacterized protein
MKESLRDRIVLITGASSGIGAATARLMSERGAHVVLCARSEDKLRRVAAGLRGPHDVRVMDVREDASVEGTVAAVMERHGRIDVLVNGAGYGEFVPFLDAPLDHFRDMMEVNYLGTVRCIRAVLPHMLRAGCGHIVNIASIAGKLATAKTSGYAATKHAVLGFTNALRQELRGTGVRVSAINPGPVDTPFFDRADPEGHYVRNVRWFMLSPERVARAVVRVVERRKAELDLPWTAAAGVRLVQLFPRLTDTVLFRLINRK